MTTTYESGSTVPSGYYLDTASWHVAPVANDGERLPAGHGRWTRIPTGLAMTLAPVLGAAFVVFLPVIGIVVTLQAIASAMANACHRSATDLVATVTPGWQPGEAHFTGRHGTAPADRFAPTTEDALDALEIEIRRRRNL